MNPLDPEAKRVPGQGEYTVPGIIVMEGYGCIVSHRIGKQDGFKIVRDP